jgi:hypothetical protein
VRPESFRDQYFYTATIYEGAEARMLKRWSGSDARAAEAVTSCISTVTTSGFARPRIG